MSSTSHGSTGPRAERTGLRVRHQVRDGIAVMTFSAATSTVLALALVLLTRLGR